MFPRVRIPKRQENDNPQITSPSRASTRSGRRSTGRGGVGNFKPSMSPIADDDKEDMLVSPTGRQVEPRWLRDKPVAIGRGGVGNINAIPNSQERLQEARRLLALEKSTLKEHVRELSFRDSLVVGGRGGAGNVHKKKKKGKSTGTQTPILSSIASAHHPILDISSDAINSLSQVPESRHRRSMITSYADSTMSISPQLAVGNTRRAPPSIDFYADDDQSEMWSVADSTMTGESEAGIVTTRFGDNWQHFDGTPFSSEFASDFSLPSLSSVCYASTSQPRSPTFAEQQQTSRPTRTPNAAAPFLEPSEDVGTVSAPEVGHHRRPQRNSVGRLARLLSAKKHRPPPLASDVSLEKHFAGMAIKSRPPSKQFQPEIPPSPTTPLSPPPRSGSANGFTSASSFQSIHSPTPSMSATAALKMIRRPKWEERGKGKGGSTSNISHVMSTSGSSVMESDAVETDTDRITAVLQTLSAPAEIPVLPTLPKLDTELSTLDFTSSEIVQDTTTPLKLDTEVLPPPRKSTVSEYAAFTPTFGPFGLPSLPTSSPRTKRITTSSGRASTRASTGRASSGRMTGQMEFGFPSPPTSPVASSPSEENELERVRLGPARCSALQLPIDA